VNDPAFQPQAESGHAGDVLLERCAALGLPVWRLDAGGHVVERPAVEGGKKWVASACFEGVVTRLARTWESDADPMVCEAFPGCWLLPLVETERRRRVGYRVVVVASRGSLSDEIVRAACAEAGIDALAAQAPGSVESPGEADRLFQWLRWTQADTEQLSRSHSEVGSFSRQLAESYEEVNLLYRLGRSMNEVEHPQKFVAKACDELHATLPFRWIAARFLPEKALARAMAGRLFTSGDPPCDNLMFREETARLLATACGEHADSRVLRPAQHRLTLRSPGPVIVQPIVLGEAFIGAVIAGEKLGLDGDVSSADLKMIEATAGYLSVLLDNAFLYDDQQAMFVGMLEALTSSIDAKDPYTCGHSHRVAELAAALARAHGLPEEMVEQVRMAGIVHDVGKIGVPEAVLCKTGRLTPEEFEQIKQHPEIGYQILKDIPHFQDLLPGVLSHHERYDGRGYPQGLAGDRIPLMARIIGLVDSFDAMSSNRTYRSAMPRGRVFEELAEHAGKQFDPGLVESFNKVDLSLYDELVELHQSEAVEGGLRIRRRRAAA
jgi:HD-GYP domain-containing protein (c-di-GMP phosphodiesterase class II)